ncbi:hypothetical protein NOCD_21535 [Nocardioides cavernae]|uniref:hypothetical protein n=1 Tax=Nocardioides TaxID=1839 RepID=UPI000AF41F62|nr:MULTISPECIES: hypothetical protein [Nocardioides]MCK9826080.1 hypothetical protein [Nocardioides cavernae]
MAIGKREIEDAVHTGRPLGGTALPSWLSQTQLTQYPYYQRSLPSAPLREVLLTSPSHVNADPTGLTLTGSVIRGDLDLSHATVTYPLRFIGCHFLGRLILRSSHLHDLALDGCTLHASDVSIAADDVDVTHSFAASQIVSAGEVRIVGARVGSVLDLNGATLRGIPLSLSAELTTVRGGITGVRLEAYGQVDLMGLRTESNLIFDGAQLHGSGISLAADDIEVRGSASLQDMSADGEVRLLGGTIGSTLDLSYAELNGSTTSLSADRLDIKGTVFGTGLEANGEVRFLGARFGNQFGLPNAVLRGLEDSLSLDGACISGDVVMDGITCEGTLNLTSAALGANVRLGGARLRSPDVAIDLSGTRISGSVRAYRIQATGEFRCLGLEVGSQFGISGSHLEGYPKSLSADRLKVGGNFLGIGLFSRGEVRLPGAHLSGQCAISELELGAKSDGINLAHTRVNETLFLNTGACGPVLADGLHAGTLLVGWSEDAMPALHPDTGPGWHIGAVRGVLEDDARAAARWLEPIAAAQPWQALASSYENNGHPTAAKRMRYLAAVRSTRNISMSRQVGRRLYQYLAGYGYYPGRALLSLGIVFFMALAVSASARSDFSTPADNASAVSTATSTRASEGGFVRSGDWNRSWSVQEFDPVLYSASVAVPALASASYQAWAPPAGPTTYVILGLRGCAWILAALLLSATTGLLRRST